MSVYETLETADIAARSRIDRWNQFASETLSALRAETTDANAFAARLTRREIGDLGIVWVSCPPSSCHGLPGNVGPWATPRRDAFVLLMVTGGECNVEQDGRCHVLRAGDMMLSDTTRAWTTTCAVPLDAIIIKLPTERMMQRFGDPEALAGMVCGGDDPRARLTRSLLMAITTEMERSASDLWDEAVADVILDSLVIAFRPGHAAHAASRRGALVRREAQGYIEKHLGDPSLSVSALAGALGTNVRTVQRAFGEIGVTPRDYILDRRLTVAAEVLRRSTTEASITGIAFESGFNDLSYFIRCFGRKFGTTPKAYRRGPRSVEEARLRR